MDIGNNSQRPNAQRSCRFHFTEIIMVLIACVIVVFVVQVHKNIVYIRDERNFHAPEIVVHRTNPETAAKLVAEAQLRLSSSKKSSSSSSSTKPTTAAAIPSNCQSTVLIIRHCEKTYSKEHCNTIGYERAKYLATLFGDNNERWPKPSHIFATSPNRDHRNVYRQVETVQPLSTRTNVPIEEYKLWNTSGMANDILDLLWSGELCSKFIVVSWEHFDMPHLAQRLGCGVEQGCPLDYPSMEYDNAWEIQFVYDEDKKERGHWLVFGSVQAEGFDPLKYGKLHGVYGSQNVGGSIVGVEE
eukprot:CAMPEP_0172486900 /NCGR_PEP_ID=MMETSP1066-20121228/15673_1 /TAXON_ID=671091 /ORGANISM="Coscinodiscus wailesii, Strain CCMP2513" /LENGTH=299 /DNA_ID=CAMNT_0013253145 /DNA_START=250 /DNA_END=1149 /DNA_ORIENTATION=+